MKQDLGSRGEYMARRFLEEEKGMEFIRANYAAKGGEIDLILLDENTLVFAEVKTRTLSSAGRYGSGADKIDEEKQLKIGKAARRFIAEERDLCRGKEIRFDAVEIYVDPADPLLVRVVHTPYAFFFNASA